MNQVQRSHDGIRPSTSRPLGSSDRQTENSPRRILILAPTPYFSLRGTPIALRHLLSHLSAQEHTIDVLTFPMGENIAHPGVRLIRCGRWLPIRSVPLGPSFTKAVLDAAIFVRFACRMILSRMRRQSQYDVIHSLDELTFGCYLLRPLLRCPVVYDMDSSIVEQFESVRGFRLLRGLASWIEKCMIRTADVVAPVCESLAGRVRAAAPEKPIVIIHDMPATDRTPGSATDDELDEEGSIVLYVGSLARHQGVNELFLAMRILELEGVPATLIVAGGSRGEIKRFTREYPQVRFLGTVPLSRLPSLFDRADVVVSPRQSGTNTPMKIYDYMDSGCVIVATDLPTHTQALDATCAMLTGNSPEELAAGISKALRNPDASRELARAARARLRSQFSPQRYSERLDRLYSIALANHRGTPT